MTGYTPNHNFYLPGGGSTGANGADEVVDIDRINENFKKIDQLLAVSDTGWVDLPMASGYEAFSPSEKPAVRRIGSRVQFKGLFKATSGNLPTASEYTPVAAGGIPAQFLANTGLYGTNLLFSAQGIAAASTGQIRIQSTGAIVVRPSTTATSYLGLYNITYLVD